jgi:hypothetical protein
MNQPDITLDTRVDGVFVADVLCSWTTISSFSLPMVSPLILPRPELIRNKPDLRLRRSDAFGPHDMEASGDSIASWREDDINEPTPSTRQQA